jgi:hypothetical protein
MQSSGSNDSTTGASSPIWRAENTRVADGHNAPE